ncbi:hypothetical protein Rhopal_005749-T1 [Rhodotorula paludigena]|uniref:RDRP core domain-containing protein n=1 Tax=Rhodotorula paludigena TaxID=86838 RepID=A0AAV5GRY7_9BASI|nr:hypothetical protein Rhopal_005749-T1 [Rhodotorula paludigena]
MRRGWPAAQTSPSPPGEFVSQPQLAPDSASPSLPETTAPEERTPTEPFLPKHLHPPNAKPVVFNNKWQGFRVDAVRLGYLDERKFENFYSERDTKWQDGMLEIQCGRRGDVALSGHAFAGGHGVKIVFRAGSITALYLAREPGDGDVDSERYHLVLSVRHTPLFFGYVSARANREATGQVRVTALDNRHALRVPYLSNAYSVTVRFKRDKSSLGAPPTEGSFADFLHQLRSNGLPDPIQFSGQFPALASRSYETRSLESLQRTLALLSPTHAYHLEGILRDGTLVPRDVLELAEKHVAPWEATAALDDDAVESVLIELRTRLAELRDTRRDWVKLRGRGGEVVCADGDVLDFDDLNPSVEQAAEEARRKVIDERAQVELVPGVKKREKVFGAEHFWCRALTVTPSGDIKVAGRILERSSAVIRRYYDAVDTHKESDRFLRVAFRDDDDRPLSAKSSGGDCVEMLLYATVARALKGGIVFGGRTYEYLGYSQSGLRDRMAWFVAPCEVEGRDGEIYRINAQAIRDRFGRFDKIECMPAKLGARYSQFFTSSHATEYLGHQQIKTREDIIAHDSQGKETNFTDGAGVMSIQLRDQVWSTLKANGFRRDIDGPPPSVIQFRLGGSKGVLAVDDTLKGVELQIRPSQDKFVGFADGEGFCLNVSDAFTRPLRLRLNRPLISALNDLGISNEVFVFYQKQAIAELEPEQLQTIAGAHYALHRLSFGGATRFKSLLKSFVEIGGIPDSILSEEPFLRQALDVIRVRSMRDLRDKASIPLPDSWVLVGVPDEDSFLGPDEVYAAIREPDKPDKITYLKGPVVVTRSPSIHPGDVRVLQGVGELPPQCKLRMRALQNCIVLPTKGDRALASMMGGGDVDGDTFQVITLADFIPTQVAEPRPYEGVPALELDRAATISDVADCFMRYITGDQTGIIANKHLALADWSDKHGFDPNCLKLADLYSEAVDAPKSGNIVDADRLPKLKNPRKRPDFMRKTDLDELGFETTTSDNFENYRSDRALGELYRNIGDDGLATPPEVLDGWERPTAATVDSASTSFRLLQLYIERQLCSLFGASAEFLETLPEVHRATNEPVLKAFCSLLRDIARTHSLLERGRQLSEQELFAVTTLQDVQRHEAARGHVVASIARSTAALVNWLERTLEGPPPEHESEIRGETLKLRYSAWILAVKEFDAYDYGVKTARWACLAMLLSAMEQERKRRDLLPLDSSSSPVGPIFGTIGVSPAVRPPSNGQLHTPPPSPSLTRSATSLPTSARLSGASSRKPPVPYSSRPRTDATTAATTALPPTERTASTSLASPASQRTAPPEKPVQPARPSIARSNVLNDPWQVELQTRQLYTRAGEDPPRFEDRGRDDSSDDVSDIGDESMPPAQMRAEGATTSDATLAAYTQMLLKLPAPTTTTSASIPHRAPTPWVPTEARATLAGSAQAQQDRGAGNAVAALGALGASSDESEARNPSVVPASLLSPVEGDLGDVEGDDESGGTDEDRRFEEEARARLYEERRRRKYLDGVHIPKHPPQSHSRTATQRSSPTSVAPSTRGPPSPTTARRVDPWAQPTEQQTQHQTLQRLAAEEEEQQRVRQEQHTARQLASGQFAKVDLSGRWGAPRGGSWSTTRATDDGSIAAPGHAWAGEWSGEKQATSTWSAPPPASTSTERATQYISPPRTGYNTPPHLRYASRGHALEPLQIPSRPGPWSAPSPVDLRAPYSPTSYTPPAPPASEWPAGESQAEYGDENDYSRPPTPPDKRRAYFHGSGTPFWAKFNDVDKRRYKSNQSGLAKLYKYVVDADGRTFEELGFGRRSGDELARGGGWRKWEHGRGWGSEGGGGSPERERELSRGDNSSGGWAARAPACSTGGGYGWGASTSASTSARGASCPADEVDDDDPCPAWEKMPHPPSPSELLGEASSTRPRAGGRSAGGWR